MGFVLNLDLLLRVQLGSSYHLPRLVGTSVASELLMTGRFITGPRALQVVVTVTTPVDRAILVVLDGVLCSCVALEIKRAWYLYLYCVIAAPVFLMAIGRK